MSYRLIKSGKNQRREYLGLNKSPLFQDLPQRDFAHEQKESYHKFFQERLPKLLDFYFPAEFNEVHVVVPHLMDHPWFLSVRFRK